MASTTMAAPRQRSNRAILILAVLFGLITAVVAYVAVTRVSEDSTASETVAPAVATETVVVALTDIPARSVISADMLTTRPVAIEGIQPGAFRTMEEVVGMVALYPTPIDHQIVAANVSEFGAEAALAYIVPEGHRAIAVNATAVKAVGGYILPGDFVDIVGLFSWAQNPDINITTTLAQDSEVLAVERSTELLELEQLEEDGAPLATSERTNGIPLVGEENPDALYMVVAVTPQEAQRVFAADFSEDAEFRFLLRRTGEHTTSFMPAFVPVFGHCPDALDAPLYGEAGPNLLQLSEEEICAALTGVNAGGAAGTEDAAAAEE
jgi:pilus assembly protein CpaB